MKIDRTKKAEVVPRDDMESGSRAERVRRILDDQRQDGGFRRGDRYEPRGDRDRPRSVSDSLMQRRGPSAPAQYVRIDLFGSRPLGIFKKPLEPARPETPVLPVWDAIHAKELKLAVTHPPANGFEEMILWTNQGKLWHFPINNEQGN